MVPMFLTSKVKTSGCISGWTLWYFHDCQARNLNECLLGKCHHGLAQCAPPYCILFAYCKKRHPRLTGTRERARLLRHFFRLVLCLRGSCNIYCLYKVACWSAPIPPPTHQTHLQPTINVRILQDEIPQCSPSYRSHSRSSTNPIILPSAGR